MIEEFMWFLLLFGIIWRIIQLFLDLLYLGELEEKELKKEMRM